MSMDLQLTTTLILLGLAVTYLGRRALRTWLGTGKGCGGGCSCPKGKGVESRKPLQELKLMRRSGDGA